MESSNNHALVPDNPFQTVLNTIEFSQEPSALADGSKANQSYPDYPTSGRNFLYANIPDDQNLAHEPKAKKSSEKIVRSKLDEIAATLNSNPEPAGQIKSPSKFTPEKMSENSSSKKPSGDQDDAYAEWQELYAENDVVQAPSPELGVQVLENKSFVARVAEHSPQGANSTIFEPDGQISAGIYFLDMWVPWLMLFLNLLMDFILMFSLYNPYTRTIQGFLFFLPHIIIWRSSYNTSKYKEFYLLGRTNMPMTAWLNGLPWTGVPIVFLQELYVVFWRVVVFPLMFWRQRYQNEQRPFYLSGNIYNESKERYVQLVRVVFEDLPTTLLLIVVLARGEDNGKLIFFSMVTSLASCACSLFALTIADRGGRPIYLKVFTTLMNLQPASSENTLLQK
jgi:hypothetical protein